MELVRVTRKLKDYRRVKKLYKTAFPPQERAPFRILMKNVKKPIVDFWAMYEGDEWVGLAYVVKNDSIAYLFYFAIDKGLRGKGYGRKTIQLLKEQYKSQKFFLALERLDENADNQEERVRRHGFYESCGLVDMPRRIREAKMTYATMGTGAVVEPEEYISLMKEYLGRFASKRVVVDMYKI